MATYNQYKKYYNDTKSDTSDTSESETSDTSESDTSDTSNSSIKKYINCQHGFKTHSSNSPIFKQNGPYVQGQHAVPANYLPMMPQQNNNQRMYVQMIQGQHAVPANYPPMMPQQNNNQRMYGPMIQGQHAIPPNYPLMMLQQNNNQRMPGQHAIRQIPCVQHNPIQKLKQQTGPMHHPNLMIEKTLTAQPIQPPMAIRVCNDQDAGITGDAYAEKYNDSVFV